MKYNTNDTKKYLFKLKCTEINKLPRFKIEGIALVAWLSLTIAPVCRIKEAEC